ncbi:Major facilitator superfamily domain general substrate transporter [Penicillium sp. DV-2018c]|nr:Major facilitator superfamily domain general substrate transporter [Penicillium sp. DV-2018c]KAJ5563521.1 Major facilitator superfamily domain general substrate transporter [Penicillium sp. DV-2018c]
MEPTAEFGVDGKGKSPAEASTDEWIVGIVNSIILLAAGLIGAFIVDPVNHYLGRRGETNHLRHCYLPVDFHPTVEPQGPRLTNAELSALGEEERSLHMEVYYEIANNM